MAAPTETGRPIVLKILLVGGVNSGKAALLNSLRRASMPVPVVGVDFIVRHYQTMDGQNVKLQMWDTAGQEKFYTISSSYCRGARGILLVYDVTNDNTFHAMMPLLRSLGENGISPKRIFVVGNTTKTDGIARIVSEEEGKQFADDRGMPYEEVSATDSESVWNLVKRLTEHVLKQDM